ncbi:HAD family hydrolase [Kitasatospora sp. NPDC056531]|uniref:HAD family hydrolase n=1 Tax=Kitasatospora sp. NPDC056531 TaxID=3345856 RepID=UPI00367EE6C8
MPIRGVLFDVDNTLFDYTASAESGVVAHLAEQRLLDLFPSPARALALWRQIMDEEVARFTAGELTFAEQRRTRTRRFLAHVGSLPPCGLSDDDASAWFAGYEAHRNAAWAEFPDAEPVLKALAPTYRLGVVSNSSVGHQRRKLDAIGLLHYFGDVLVCSDQHGEAKPARSIFHAGCTLLGLAPDEVAYVGDMYAIDAVGARDAGLHSYWLDRTGAGANGEAGEGIQVIRSLHELPPALGS